jgi:hypothetical protein
MEKQAMFLRPALVIVLAVVIAGSVCAETFVVEIPTPEVVVYPELSAISVDLGALFTGITDIRVRMIGVGGGGTFVCSGAAPSGWYNSDIYVGVGSADYVFSTVDQVPFDLTVRWLRPWPDPWAHLEGVSQTFIMVRAQAHLTGLLDDCAGNSGAAPLVDLIELQVDADQVVGDLPQSWGAVKALYLD